MRSKDFYKLPEGALLFNTIEEGTCIVKTQMIFWQDRNYYVDVKPIRGKSYTTPCADLQRIPITEENLKMLGFKEVSNRNTYIKLRYRKLELLLMKSENSQCEKPDYVRIMYAENIERTSIVRINIQFVDELQSVLHAIKAKYPKIFVNR